MTLRAKQPSRHQKGTFCSLLYATKLPSTHPITPGRGPNRRNSSFTVTFSSAVLGKWTHLLRVPALTIMHGATRRTQMPTAGCVNRYGLLASHGRLQGSGGEGTRGAHLCRSTESTARESIGDFVAQSQHRCLTRVKATPKLFVWHVKRDLDIPPALVVRHVHVAKRYSECHCLSRHHHFSYFVCDGPTRWLFHRSSEPIPFIFP
ncbi:hypothetical protein MRX96_056439 [Rhipicephalus microplus]